MAAIRTRLLLGPLVLVITACAGSEPVAPTTVTETVTTTQTVVGPTRTVTVTASPTAEAASEVDLAQWLVEGNEEASWAPKVIKVERTGSDSIEVMPRIIDPRGGAGSPEAMEAVEVCRAAVQLMQAEGIAAPKVRVLEGDGSTFAMVDQGACVEV